MPAALACRVGLALGRTGQDAVAQDPAKHDNARLVGQKS